ncbi:delta-sarcoglycan-like [Sarcoptes scabiei]|nr:delta-sarcoglycan-like [Sarcoptes scabiei]
MKLLECMPSEIFEFFADLFKQTKSCLRTEFRFLFRNQKDSRRNFLSVFFLFGTSANSCLISQCKPASFSFPTGSVSVRIRIWNQERREYDETLYPSETTALSAPDRH